MDASSLMSHCMDKRPMLTIVAWTLINLLIMFQIVCFSAKVEPWYRISSSCIRMLNRFGNHASLSILSGPSPSLPPTHVNQVFR